MLPAEEVDRAKALVTKVLDVIKTHCAETGMPITGGVSCVANVVMTCIVRGGGPEFAMMLVGMIPDQQLTPDVEALIQQVMDQSAAETAAELKLQ